MQSDAVSWIVLSLHRRPHTSCMFPRDRQILPDRSTSHQYLSPFLGQGSCSMITYLLVWGKKTLGSTDLMHAWFSRTCAVEPSYDVLLRRLSFMEAHVQRRVGYNEMFEQCSSRSREYADYIYTRCCPIDWCASNQFVGLHHIAPCAGAYKFAKTPVWPLYRPNPFTTPYLLRLSLLWHRL